ncbi:hypothetical protein CANARDRAFT_29403 [[Candida] arabinofermentans NRRL YB-2248]|uniref:DH domain-containing protein n=1 Tax=[Candida] arabinofermentans NRRL YB-2248 TaxID=983967 RepID=A0A1E4SXL9_9ASCO|nr:hypothetical protein CANARDRAFT_29403 [[Candida] arabinofermentans NRRL YB-2248]
MFPSRATSISSHIRSSSIYSERPTITSAKQQYYHYSSEVTNSHQADSSKPKSYVNPYSESLWYLTRLNHGEEIKILQKRKANQKGLSISIPNIEYVLKSDSDEKQLPAVPKMTTISSASFETGKLLEAFPTPDMDLDLFNQIMPSASLNPATTPVVQSIINIEKKYTRSMRVVLQLRDSFKSFINDTRVPINNRDVLMLFGDFKIMIDLSDYLLNCLLDNTSHQTVDAKQEIILDYFNRILQVYPAYLSTVSRRATILKYFESDTRLESWLEWAANFTSSQDVENFRVLLWSPMRKLSDYIAMLQSLADENSAFQQYAIKLQSLLDTDNISNPKSELQYPCLLADIPIEWKQRNKIRWKELSKEPVHYQQLEYYQSELKTCCVDYKKLIKYSKVILAELSKSGYSNIRAAESFIKFKNEMPNEQDRNSTALTPKSSVFKDSFIRSSYQLYLEKIQRQNQSINSWIGRFEQVLDSRVAQLDIEVYNAVNKLKELAKNRKVIDSDRMIESLIKLVQFKEHLRQAVYLLSAKLDKLLLLHLSLVKGHTSTATSETKEYKKIIEEYSELRTLNKNILVSQSKGLGPAAFTKALALTKVIKRLYRD